jgi:hypothetical protein
MRYNGNIKKHAVLPLIVILSVCTIFPLASQPSVNSNSFLIWGSGGYSKISNNVPATTAIGNAGMAIGAGYELHFKNFLIQTGVEVSYYTSKMSLIDTLLVMPMIDTEGTLFSGHFAFQQTSDMQKIANIGIPLMLGYETPDGLYFAIGGKVMLNVIGSSHTSTNVTSTAYYSDLIGDNSDGILSNMPNHELNSEMRTVNSSLKLHTIFTGSVEAGYTFGKNPDDYSIKNKPKIRLSMCCDYGFAPVTSNDRINNLFVNISTTEEIVPTIRGYLLNSLQSNRLNVLYVGLKVTVLFGLKKYGCNCSSE